MAPSEHGSGVQVGRGCTPGSLREAAPVWVGFAMIGRDMLRDASHSDRRISVRGTASLEQKKPPWVVCLVPASTGRGPDGQGRQDRVPEFPPVWEDKGVSVAEH